MHSRNSSSTCLLSLAFLMSNTDTPAVSRESRTRFCYRHSGVAILGGEVQLTAVPLHVRSACGGKKAVSFCFASSFLGVRGPSSCFYQLSIWIILELCFCSGVSTS